MSEAKIVMMRLFSIMLVAVIAANQVSAEYNYATCSQEVKNKMDGKTVVTDLMKRLSQTIEELNLDPEELDESPDGYEHLLESLKMSPEEASQLLVDCREYGEVFKNAAESTQACPIITEDDTELFDTLSEDMPEVFVVLENCSILAISM